MSDRIIAIRNKDIINAYFDSIKCVHNINPLATWREIIEHTSKKSAPRFYATFENSRRFISLMNRGLDIPISNTNKINMYNEIYKRFTERGGGDRYVILRDILEEEAPSFYLSFWEMYQVIYKSLRKK